jgi:outer membrane receptor protein involved in Fe transport
MKYKMKKTKSIVLSIMGLIILYPFTLQASDWDYTVELYMFGTTIEGNASLGRSKEVDVDVDFNDILDTLKIGGMIHFEAVQKTGWGAVLDYRVMDLRDDLSGPRGGVAGVKIRQGVFQADLLYRVPVWKGDFDYVVGFRWWDNDFEVTVDSAMLPGSATVKDSEDWVDLCIGARWTIPLNEKLNFMIRGDVGGLGLQADFTAFLFADIKYAMTEHWLLDIGYTATWVDYQTGTRRQPGYFAYDTVTHGPLAGIIYKF